MQKEITFKITKPGSPKGFVFVHARTNGETYKLHIDDECKGTIFLELSEDEFQQIYNAMGELKESIKS